MVAAMKRTSTVEFCLVEPTGRTTPSWRTLRSLAWVGGGSSVIETRVKAKIVRNPKKRKRLEKRNYKMPWEKPRPLKA